MSVPRIGVVGSYATGLTLRVKRLPSRGETVLATGYRADHGGKGSNQAVGCARLGAQVSFVARIGKDEFAEMALRLYQEEGIDISFVRMSAEQPTGVGFILVEESGNNCIALDPGANALLTSADVLSSQAVLETSSVVLTQLEIPVKAAERALALGRANGATTILNPAPVRSLPSSALALVDVLTPNQSEARVLTGRDPEENANPEEVARDLVHLGVKNVVMTLGEQGALIVTESSSKHVPAMPMQAVDTTGAGDAFNAGLATALAWSENLDSAVKFAVVMGGLAVTKEGVIPSLPRREEVASFYEERGLNAPQWLISLSESKRV